MFLTRFMTFVSLLFSIYTSDLIASIGFIDTALLEGIIPANTPERINIPKEDSAT